MAHDNVSESRLQINGTCAVFVLVYVSVEDSSVYVSTNNCREFDRITVVSAHQEYLDDSRHFSVHTRERDRAVDSSVVTLLRE